MTDAEADHLAREYLTESRLSRFEQVASRRLCGVTVLCENVVDVRNLSACLRSAEAMGIPKLHAVMNCGGGQSLRRNVASGASRWVELEWHDSTEDAIAALKGAGYTLIGTSVDAAAVSFRDVELPDRVAVCMGPEFGPMSDTLANACDTVVHIPMFGFTESLNLSVATSIILENFSARMRDRPESTLPAQAVERLIRNWCRADLQRKFGDQLPAILRRHKEKG